MRNVSNTSFRGRLHLNNFYFSQLDQKSFLDIYTDLYASSLVTDLQSEHTEVYVIKHKYELVYPQPSSVANKNNSSYSCSC